MSIEMGHTHTVRLHLKLEDPVFQVDKGNILDSTICKLLDSSKDEDEVRQVGDSRPSRLHIVDWNTKVFALHQEEG